MSIKVEILNKYQQNKILLAFFRKLAALPNNLVFFCSIFGVVEFCCFVTRSH